MPWRKSADHRHDSDRKAVGVRHVRRNEIYPGLVQSEQEMGVAREAIQLGDDELGAMQPARCERRFELWPISPLAAFNLAPGKPTLLVMGEPGSPSERLAREADLRATALGALRTAGVR